MKIAIKFAFAATGLSALFALPAYASPINDPAVVESTVPAKPDDCLQHRTGADPLPVGEYHEFASLNDPGVTGTTRWGIMPCGPTPAPPVVTETPSLPATGNETSAIAIVAFGLLVLGSATLRAARR